jgi:hypothetical protein
VDTAGIISTVADGGADPILPTRIAADTLGNLYVGSDTWNLADRVGVRRVTPAGIVETVAGTSPMERTPEKTGPDFSQMQSFSGVAVDGAGNLFVAGVPASSCGNLSQTAWSTSVRKIALTGVITTVAGDPLLREGKCAQAGPPLNLPVLRSPGAFSGNFIAIDGAGNLFISEFDTNTSTASIRKITPDGTLSFFNPAIP